MSEYSAPLQEMRFVIEALGPLAEISALPGYEEVTPDLVDAVLSEAGKFASEVLAPLNRVGDLEGARYATDGVRTAAGWKEAYDLFIDGGWNGIGCAPQFGGQGLPKLLATAVSEMWDSANIAFALGPLLTRGAIEAIEAHGSDAQRETYLHKMVSGLWTGTMNLTEPQAGSDLSVVRTRAVRAGDHYLLSGQKIFITYGEHDLTENIIHLVLARVEGAPAGTRGLSLFIVPKFLVTPGGTLGARNDVRCASIEHKLGIHGSPTAVMLYGEQGGAVGYLVGEENRGLEYMFTMMNNARHGVGIEAVGLAERAYQQARAFARERVQGRPLGYAGGTVPTIVEHPDVRRMLVTMKSQIDAMRALIYVCGAAFDRAGRSADAEERAYWQRRADLLTPIVKGWCTETGIELVSVGLQVHGGMGYIEETGAAQYLRDARITTIYEGTTGVQAADLVGRKTLRDGGRAIRELLAEIARTVSDLGVSADERARTVGRELGGAVAALEAAVQWLLAAGARNPGLPGAASRHFLQLCGTVAGGWLLGESALACLRGAGADDAFRTAKLETARFYALQILTGAEGLRRKIVDGSEVVLGFDADAL